MTLEEHAAAIEAVIQAAYDEGYELDNGDAAPIRAMELNFVDGGTIQDWVSIHLPEPTYC